MSFIRDDRYEEVALSYQCHMMALLDTTLQSQGISEEKKRRKMIYSFLFHLGQFHDRAWLRPSEGVEKSYLLLCFTETFLNTITPVSVCGAL